MTKVSMTKNKRCTNPGDTNFTTYKIFMTYFRDGNPKQWLFFKKQLTLCLTGQNTSGRAVKYALARQLLTRRTLADFNNTATLHRNQ